MYLLVRLRLFWNKLIQSRSCHQRFSVGSVHVHVLRRRSRRSRSRASACTISRSVMCSAVAEEGVGGAEGDVDARTRSGRLNDRLELGGCCGRSWRFKGSRSGPARTEEAIGGDQRLDVDLLAGDGEVGARGLAAEGAGLGPLAKD